MAPMLLVVGAVVVVALVVGAGPPQWGTVGEWMSGVAAAVLIIVTWLLWRGERAERQREEQHHRAERAADEERRASHAVNAWVEQVPDPRGMRVFGEDEPMVPVVVVANSGGDVVTSWLAEVAKINVQAVEDEDGQLRTQVDPPTWAAVATHVASGALPPGRQITVAVPEKFGRLLDGARVTFFDAEGRQWRRRGDEIERLG